MLGHSSIQQPSDLWDARAYESFLTEYYPIYQQLKQAQEMVKLQVEYGRRLPVYLTSRCPFCGDPKSEPVDTFSLNGFGWGMANYGAGWSALLGLPPREPGACNHLRITVYFLNLRGQIPSELFADKKIKTGPEVPSVMRVPMAPDDARVVIHELPIGRFGEDPLQQRYSVYFLTYFTESPASFEKATKDWGVHYGRIEYNNIDYDLQGWAQRKRLLWLKPDDPELPLADISTDKFPYADIQGDRTIDRVITREGVVPPRQGILQRLFGTSRKDR